MTDEITKEQALKLIDTLNDDRKDLNKRIDNLLKQNMKLKEQLEKKNKVIEEARKRLGTFANEMGQNGNAYAICVDVLDILNKGVDENEKNK